MIKIYFILFLSFMKIITSVVEKLIFKIILIQKSELAISYEDFLDHGLPLLAKKCMVSSLYLQFGKASRINSATFPFAKPMLQTPIVNAQQSDRPFNFWQKRHE